MSSTTLKLFNKFSNNLIKDFIGHLESNDIHIPDEISQSFLIEKPSKRKGKLSPYTIFMKEYRSNFQKEHPNMSFQEVSQAVAEEWRKIRSDPSKLEEFTEKAQKFNNELPKNTKKLCKATKGSDKQPCKAEARLNSDFCGRHKKLEFDSVETEDIQQYESEHDNDDYLYCQYDGCSENANSGPFCNQHSHQEKTCIKEKPNGQICGKKATKDNYCGFHDPNKPKRKAKNTNVSDSETEHKGKKIKTKTNSSSPSSSSSSSSSSNSSTFGEKSMYYDENMNIHMNPPNGKYTKFIMYDNDGSIGYNSDGEEIGIVKDNKFVVFTV